MKLFRQIELLWQYMQLQHRLTPTDCLLVMCSNDLRVAEHAVNLYKQGYAPYILFSGGEGRFTEGLFEKSEAETFAELAKASGVPEEAILLETKSSNSGENVRFSEQLLIDKGLVFESFILVQKPFMERRALATFEKQWQGAYSRLLVSSTEEAFFDYINEEMPLMLVLEALLEDFERIKHYPAKGFQTEQPLPDDVETAYQEIRAKLTSLLV
ncbi:YdcF family protein [Vibrio vulnificus]|uniref:YdcF family protein n=1 Tax=Vibrio vulnificus TaxID=672 RepID=UPI001A2593FF|nr:YdcF family protein [Vibrio vulnificus]EHH0795332.1 YdcF family protein [Vibrio vulnificus]EHH1182527.1 YdcF family protein [Vibrio vulnificus]EHH1188246.1 YdcF family protein [Vibrio vulnificus]EHH1227138.1 YdcF family protein [Vibrio vulnificus]EHI9278199.1 YdcF family protein [Vibrio vulnificus]